MPEFSIALKTAHTKGELDFVVEKLYQLRAVLSSSGIQRRLFSYTTRSANTNNRSKRV